MKSYLREQLIKSLESLGLAEGEIRPSFEKPRSPDHGDLTTNVAMALARQKGENPRLVAERIVKSLKIDTALVDRVEIAGPGFINFHFTDRFYLSLLSQIISKGSDFGKADIGKGMKTQVEFVSANPTGPLTVGHGRGAVFGDTISRLLQWTNYDVTREYYFNDAGRQMRILGDSVRMRYLELIGEKVDFPEDYYQGQYIREIAAHLKELHSDALKEEGAEGLFKQQAEEEIFDDIKKTLARLGIKHDVYFNEKTLYEKGMVEEVIAELRAGGLAYDKEGAVWFRAGGEKDKVIVKSTGEPTYRLPDIAYHREKLRRGFDLVIDVLGADHVATYPDVLAGLSALGFDSSKVKVLIHQFVTIVQEGEVVKMSTRKANFITLDELTDEVGPDVVRYFFLMRGIDSHLNFDLKLAKDNSENNPVYYLQYAHARIASIVRYAQSQDVRENRGADLSLLQKPEELSLMKLLAVFPDMVESCAATFEPHRMAEYLQQVAGDFHKFYHAHRVVTENQELTAARMQLCEATRIILSNGLSILGISAPEKM